MERKICKGCSKEHPLSNFSRRASSPDGLMYKCKECDYARQKQWRKENPGKEKAKKKRYRENNPEKIEEDKLRQRRNYDRNREARIAYAKEYQQTEHGKQKKQAQRREWTKNNPRVRQAGMKVYKAIQSGRLIRKPCEICGGEAQAHHEDYSKPLEVRWLCQTHHAELHKRQRRAPA